MGSTLRASPGQRVPRQSAYHPEGPIRQSKTRTAAGWTLLALALGAIGALTLQPIPAQARQSAATPFLCLLCGGEGTADFVLNVALFLPLGIALHLLGLRRGPAIGLAALATGLVEGLQFTAIPGRDTSLGDLVANTGGAWAGLALAASWQQVCRPKPALARRLAAGWVFLVVAVIALSYWALRPSLPGGTWYGQWVTGSVSTVPDYFEGRVLRAELGSRPMPHWRLADGADRREELLRTRVRLWAEITTGRPERELRRILSVASDTSRFVGLATRGADLRFGVRMRSRLVRLRSPSFTLADAMPSAPGARAEVEGSFDRGRVSLTASTAAGTARAAFRVYPIADGWMVLLPWTVTGGATTAALRLAWLAGLFLPLAWWMSRSWAGAKEAQ